MKKQIVAVASILSLSLALGACSEVAEDAEEAQVRILEVVEGEEQKIIETVIYDQGGVKITITGLEKEWGGSYLSYTIENTSDLDISVYSDLLSIDGVMSNGFFIGGDVPAGKTLNSGAFFDSEPTVGETQIEGEIVISDLESYERISQPKPFYYTLD